MDSKSIVSKWFNCWASGDVENLPISENFSHTSPFGRIISKQSYLKMVHQNRDKFLGYRFEIVDALYDETSACVRYLAIQDGLELAVSEWYYFENELIQEIVSYYHIGEIREERKLK